MQPLVLLHSTHYTQEQSRFVCASMKCERGTEDTIVYMMSNKVAKAEISPLYKNK